MQQPPEQIVRGIKLPCSSARASKQSFAKLLSRVDPEAYNGFGFEGIILRPGRTFTEAELRPPDFPSTPILLEYVGPSGPKRGHNRNAQLYILWRYEQELRQWVELGRARSVSWEWALDLRPLAVRALREARGSEMQVLPNLVMIAGRIAVFLDTELQPLERSDRERVLAVLHDEFASRIVAAR